MKPFVYRIWRGFGLYWHDYALQVEVFWRVFFWGFFDTVKYSRTRYTDVGLLGLGVHITTNSIGVPIAFAEAHNAKVRANK